MGEVQRRPSSRALSLRHGLKPLSRALGVRRRARLAPSLLPAPAVLPACRWGPGGLPTLDAITPALLHSSLTSLDIHFADVALQPGALAALPRLRRLVLGSLMLGFQRDFELLEECPRELVELQVGGPGGPAGPAGTAPLLMRCLPACRASRRPSVAAPPPAVSRLQRRSAAPDLPVHAAPAAACRWVEGRRGANSGQQLGQVLSCLPLLEALSLAGCNALQPGEQQEQLWAAWTPAPQRLRSLEVQLRAAARLPPSAAPHLAQLHTLWCDWAMLCNSPAILAACGQLRRLHVLVGVPAGPGQTPEPTMTAGATGVLVGALASLPHLAAIQCPNFLPAPGSPARLRPVAADVLRLLSEARARLPGVRIPPTVLASPEYEGEHRGTCLGIWSA